MDTSIALILLIVLSALSLLAVLVVLFVALRRREITHTEVGAAISETWVRLGLGEAIGKIDQQALEIRNGRRGRAQALEQIHARL